MKRVFVLAAAIFLTGCGKLAKNTERDVSPDTVPGIDAAVQASPPPEAGPRYAPDGVWFTTQRVSVATSSGVSGFAPGTKLRRIKPGVYEVNGEQLKLTAAQVTNDLAVVEHMSPGHGGAPVAGSISTAHAESTPAPVRRPVVLATPKRGAATTVTSLANPTPAGSPDASASPPRTLLGAPVQTHRSVNDRIDASGRRYHKGIYGQRIYD